MSGHCPLSAAGRMTSAASSRWLPGPTRPARTLRRRGSCGVRVTGSADGSIWVGYPRPRAKTTDCPFLEHANSPSRTGYRKICAAQRMMCISSIYRLSRCTAPRMSSPQRLPIRQSTVSCTLRGSIAITAPTRRRWRSTSNRVAGSVVHTWPSSSLFGTGSCIPRSSVNSNARGIIAARRTDRCERWLEYVTLSNVGRHTDSMPTLSPGPSTAAHHRETLASERRLLRNYLPDLGRIRYELSRLRRSWGTESDSYPFRSGHVGGVRNRRPIRARRLPGPRPWQWYGFRVLLPGLRLPDRNAFRHPQLRGPGHGTVVRCRVADGAR